LPRPDFLDKPVARMIYFKGNDDKGFCIFENIPALKRVWHRNGSEDKMTPQAVVDIGREALMMTLLIAAPPLLAGLAVGLIISIFQAVTQIQEFTLTFIPKILAVFVATMIFLPWMLRVFLAYTTDLFIKIPMLAK
jgi:flagellar biosynthetic protein FliQ